MKKVFIGITLLLSVSSVFSASRWYWPTYIDNTNCLTKLAGVDGYPECGTRSFPDIGDNVIPLGDFPELHTKILELNWLRSNSYTDNYGDIKLTTPSYSVVFIPGVIDGPKEGPFTDTIPLEGAGGTTKYRLLGMNKGKFRLSYDGCYVKPTTLATYPGVVPKCYLAEEKNILVGEVTVQDLLSGSIPNMTKRFNAYLGKYPYMITKVNVEFVRGDTEQLRLRSYAKSIQDQQVRKVKLPGFSVSYKLDNHAGSNPTTYSTVVSSSIARLNDRKCQLDTSKVIDFKTINLNSNDSGKIGNEISAQIKLICNGFFDGQDPNGTGTENNTGSYVRHTVTGVSLTSTEQVVGLDNQNKIALKSNDHNAKAENLYVEASFQPGQECSTNAIPLGESAVGSDWGMFGDSNTSVTVPNIHNIYWKLCKKPGEVLGGDYTGTVTLKLKYK